MKIPMHEIIHRYKECDTFSLSIPYFNKYLSKRDASRALKEVEEYKDRILTVCYNELIKDNKDFPEFGELIDEITNLASAHQLKTGSYEFFCDTFLESKYASNKYKNAHFIWNIFHEIEMFYTKKEQIEEYEKSDDKKDVLEFLKNKEYENLIHHILDYKITHSNGVTVSSSLILTFYFSVNEETLTWLSNRKHVYDFNKFEDLCFYKNFKQEFWSCTHNNECTLDYLEGQN